MKSITALIQQTHQSLIAWMITVIFMLILTPVSRAQQLPFSTLTIADGLEDMVVFDIEQDDLGFLWITTRTGVNRFDGTHFDTFKQANGLPHNLVRDLLITRDGSVWAASEAGLAFFDGTEFKHVLPELWPNTVSGRAIQEASDGSLWVATYGLGLLQLKITDNTVGIVQQFNHTTGFPSDRIRSLMVAEDGTVWAGDQSQVYHITGGQFEVVEWQAQPSEIRNFYQHTDQSIWVGTRQGVAIFNGDAFVEKTFDVDLSQYSINHITRNSAGQVWVSTRDFGAFLVGSNAQISRHFNMDIGLPDNSINTIYEDNENNLWLGTYGGGLARLSTSDVLNWKAQAGMPYPNVYVITSDSKGCFWVGTNGDGVSSICGNQIKHITTDDGLSHNKVLSGLIDQHDNPWFGTLQGVNYWQGDEIHQLDTADGLSGSVVYHMTNALDGGILMATNNGLSHYHAGKFTNYNKSNGLLNNRINRVLQSDDGSVWLGTSSGLSQMKDQQFTNWTSEDGLAANFINDMYQDKDGMLWLATNNGLSQFNGTEFTTWTMQDGLPHNNITTLLPGANDDLWIGTSRGVAIYDQQSFTVITAREGLVFDLVNRSAGYKDQAGNLWFGTGEGISRFASDFKPGSSTPPPIHLLNVSSGQDDLNLANPSVLSEQNSDLTFLFTAISFQRAADLNYRYRLATKASDPWRQTRLNEIQINSLAAGDYQFQVTARIGHGEWNPNPAVYNFTVEPPFWRTPWFILLLVATVLMAWIYRGWRNRQHALQLEQLVQQRTKELNQVNQGLDWMANHDNLTKLANRHHIQDYLSSFNQVSEAAPFGVLIIDLDYFKAINDQFGHSMGDFVLQNFSSMLKKTVHTNQVAARWGGEEFIVICPKISQQNIKKLANDILQGCRRLRVNSETDQIISLNCSLGYVHLSAFSPAERLTRQMEKTIQLADKALYEAKHNGRDQVCGYIIEQMAKNMTLDDYISNTNHAIKQRWMLRDPA